MYLKSPFYIGKAKLPNNLFYAPLAGCSDYPFRKMPSRFLQPGLRFTEMVKMDALIRNDPGTFSLLSYAASMRPIGAQLCGSRPEIAGKAAHIIEDLGFDIVDLNCGCPVDKVTKDGSGSGLLKTPEKIGELVSTMVSAVNIPVTVKIRAGWDEDEIVVEKITKIAESAGASAIVVHGRTREQAYRGFANRSYIKAAKDAATSIKVIGNGDIFDPVSAKGMFEETECDGILLSRGTMGQPWLAQTIADYLETGRLYEDNFDDQKKWLIEHFREVIDYMPPKRALIDMRRIGCWYIKKKEGTKALRDKMAHATNIEEMEAILEGL